MLIISLWIETLHGGNVSLKIFISFHFISFIAFVKKKAKSFVCKY